MAIEYKNMFIQGLGVIQNSAYKNVYDEVMEAQFVTSLGNGQVVPPNYIVYCTDKPAYYVKYLLGLSDSAYWEVRGTCNLIGNTVYLSSGFKDETDFNDVIEHAVKSTTVREDGTYSFGVVKDLIGTICVYINAPLTLADVQNVVLTAEAIPKETNTKDYLRYAIFSSWNRNTCRACHGVGEITRESGTCKNCGGTGIDTSCNTCGGGGTTETSCSVCNGKGTVGDNNENCANCLGRGKITTTCSTCSGSGKHSTTCTVCGGDGIITSECKVCSGSTTTTKCGTCKGTGKVAETCSTCEGDGILDSNICSVCNGEGVVKTCLTCKGTGKVTNSCTVCGGDGELDKCPNCSNGNIVCENCAGDGVLESGENCTVCGGDGMISCTVCGGDGKIDPYICDTCNGKGTITKTCTDCEGFGEYSVAKICENCKGNGIINTKCTICGGDGQLDIDCVVCGGDGELDNAITCWNCDGTGTAVGCSHCGGDGTDSTINDNCQVCGGDGQLEIGTCSRCKGSGLESNYFVEPKCTVNGLWPGPNITPTLSISPYFDSFGEEIENTETNLVKLTSSSITTISGSSSDVSSLEYTASFTHENLSKDSSKFVIWSASDSQDGVLTANVAMSENYFKCLSGDTLVTLADYSQKRLDQLNINDVLLTSKGPAKITELSQGEISNYYHTKYYFENDIIIDETRSHRFYNHEQGFFQFLGNWNLGEHAIDQNGNKVALISKERIEEEAFQYAVWTETGDYYANGLLTGETTCNRQLLSSSNAEQIIDMLLSMREGQLDHLLGHEGGYLP